MLWPYCIFSDPLNLPQWRKWLAVCVVSLFGSLALSAELVIGGLLPVFVLDYAGVPVSLLNDNRNLPALLSGSGAAGGSLNPLAIIPPGTPPGPPVEQIALLATVPLVGNSVASYLLVPLSVAIGRRPVLILAAAAAWGGGAWAGLSTSLLSHIMARAMLGLGAGAVEALIPLVIQDLMFIHERNTAMAVVVGAQGIFTVAFGVAAPVIATRYYWRLLYVITSGATFLAWLAVIAAVPETRWTRCREELSMSKPLSIPSCARKNSQLTAQTTSAGGQNIFPLRPGANRPDLDARTYGPRTRQTDLALFPFGFEWRQAGGAILETLKTTFFPTVLWAVVANAIFIVAAQAAGQIGAFALLAQGWQFQYTGLATITFLAAGVLAFVFGGPLADMLSNKVTRWNGGGREPEHHLPNLVLPFLAGILGAFLFGWAAENNLHWAVLLGGVTLIVFASLTVLTILNVFIVESYPMWAG